MSACIEWAGSRDVYGYGRIKIHGKAHKAHRLAYEKSYGGIPEGLFVCHKCDNPPCVNPDHLYAGTAADNARDSRIRGRRRRGTAHWQAKLTAEKVLQIRAARDTGETYKSIASRYGITDVQARNVATRKQWAYL
jgi:hypothetical protein